MKPDIEVHKSGDITFYPTKNAKRVLISWVMSLDIYGKDTLLGGVRKRADLPSLKELVVCGIRIKIC